MQGLQRDELNAHVSQQPTLRITPVDFGTSLLVWLLCPELETQALLQTHCLLTLSVRTYVACDRSDLILCKGEEML